MTETKPFAARMKDFFGYLPGQKLGDFMAELKALSAADKAEFCEAFNAMGLPTQAPKEVSAS